MNVISSCSERCLPHGILLTIHRVRSAIGLRDFEKVNLERNDLPKAAFPVLTFDENRPPFVANQILLPVVGIVCGSMTRSQLLCERQKGSLGAYYVRAAQSGYADLLM